MLLRSSAPTFSRVGSLQDPAADDPHGSFGGRGGWWGRFSQQMRISNLGLWEGLKRSNRGSSNGRIYDFVVGRGLAPAVYRGFMTNNRLFAAGASPRPTGTPSMFILPINPNLKSAFAGRQVFSILPCTALTKKFFIPIDSQPYQCYNTVEPYYSNNTVQVRKACNT